MLVDYAHERWSAGRSVSPELWRCVGPHADAAGLAALARALEGVDDASARGAARALAACPDPRARAILARRPEMALAQPGTKA